MQISKSKYIRGCQCEKALWLKVHHKEVLTPADDTAMKVFATGSEVGDLACKLFPGGTEILFDPADFGRMAKTTERLIQNGTEIIYEATFLDEEENLVMVDILKKEDDGWSIYEVKSSTGVKDVYVDDAAMQRYVLEKCGLDVKKVYIVHLNKAYRRDRRLDLHDLFTIVDITEKTKEKQNDVKENLARFHQILQTQKPPEIEVGTRCFKPYRCDALEHCWRGYETRYPSLFSLVDTIEEERMGDDPAKKTGSYTLDELVVLWHEGKRTLADLDSSKIPNTVWKQKRQLSAEREGLFQKEEKLDAFFEGIGEHRAYLTIAFASDAVPRYRGYGPYENYPVAFELLLRDKTAEQYYTMRAENAEDPRSVVDAALRRLVPPEAAVVVYMDGYGLGALKKLGFYIEREKRVKNLRGVFEHFAWHARGMGTDFGLEAVARWFGVKAETETARMHALLEQLQQKRRNDDL